ncbi:unnamed protein product [Echinostoma caproni]|uniref:Reverse transcriptase domain-containing protein n=1 Tax=Echinostoma caproni TaxID=27848 RepID=A0A183BBK5_9TREM|nr:unnamed protein product [Echinostoma caproni]
MRRIAEADAADRARRSRRQRRRCDTECLESGVPTVDQTQMDVDSNLIKVNEEVGDLMNYKPHEELEIVEDTLAVLDEEMHDQEAFDNDEEDDDEEGLPSSLIPRINIGDAFQAVIPEFNAGEFLHILKSDHELSCLIHVN